MNRQERLRLQKNTDKLRRQTVRAQARAKDASRALERNLKTDLKSVFLKLGEEFKAIEAKNKTVSRCLERLVIRCDLCVNSEFSMEELRTQLEGLQFETRLARRAQEPLVNGEFAAIDELTQIIGLALQVSSDK